MNPYLSPFTMPDGTARRAFFERVPEAKTEALGWEYQIRGDVFGARMHEVGLVLCRSAVEDWLIGFTTLTLHSPISERRGKGQDFCVGLFWDTSLPTLNESAVDYWIDDVEPRWCRKDVHHALTAAAHARADAIGIAP